MRHYETYGRHKAYATPQVTDKHIRRLDREIWEPGGYRTNMAVLEIGCGTGLVMAYLHRKGVRSLTGIDQDAALADVVPEPVRGAFEVADAWAFIDKTVANSTTYDRIIMFDVIEHFDSEAGCQLLSALLPLLASDGCVHLKVPNAGSPWGQQFQYGDLTHKTAYTPESLRQQAVAAGYRCQSVYPQRLGSPARQVYDRLVHGLLDRLLTSPPEIWDGNVYALLAPE